MSLTDLMRQETAHLTPAPTLLQSVRAGGQRRRRHRRIAATTAVAFTLVGVAGGVRTIVVEPPVVTRYAGPAFDGRTHGDLAGDAAYLRAVVAAWEASHAESANRDRGIFEDLRGAPRVVWAGTTRVGRAAVVAQDAFLHHHDNIQLEREGIHELLGFVGPGADGGPRVVGDAYPSPDSIPATAWYVDAEKTLVAALNTGRPNGISFGWTYRPDGAAVRDYRPMQDRDGVELADVPPGGPRGGPAVVSIPYRTFADAVQIHGAPPAGETTYRLPWTGSRTLSGPPTTPRKRLAVLARVLDERRRGAVFSVRGGTWSVVGTAGAHSFIVGEIGLDDDRTRAYAVVDDEDVVDGGFVDPAGVRPVVIRLPDGVGVVVVRYGAELSYRIRRSGWVDVGRDAALVPAGATELLVTPDVGPPQTVSLTP